MSHSKQKIETSVSDFAVDFYKEIISRTTGDNVFISPTSVFVVMAMLHAGARNKTLDQLTSALKIDPFSAEQMLKRMNKFVNILSSGSESVVLNSANRLYPSVQGDILQSFIDLMKKNFLTDVKPKDFLANPDGARQEINSWVESQTNSKIKDLLPINSIKENTCLVLVNAVYFKGDWETPFEDAGTHPRDFHISKDLKVSVDMMSNDFQEAMYGENKELDCKVLELMYKGKEVGMVVFLPNNVDGLSALEATLDSTSISTSLNTMTCCQVLVQLPKFTMECTVKMKPVLIALGIVDAFNLEADLSGMGDSLFVDDVFHKAFVNVNEKGTEATAATAAVVARKSGVEFRAFLADHPFLFAIWDHRLNVPLFMGRYTGPK